jgi:hypothetical protein
VKYAFVQRHRRVWPISVQCRVLRISLAGYHEHFVRKASQDNRDGQRRHLSDDALLVHIKAIHAETRGGYGWPRIWKELLARGIRVGARTECKSSCSAMAFAPEASAASISPPTAATRRTIGGNAKNGITRSQARRQAAVTVGNFWPQGLRSNSFNASSAASALGAVYTGRSAAASSFRSFQLA